MLRSIATKGAQILDHVSVKRTYKAFDGGGIKVLDVSDGSSSTVFGGSGNDCLRSRPYRNNRGKLRRMSIG